jgi:hypothetical protein
MSLVSAKELAKAIQLDKPAFLGKLVGQYLKHYACQR